MHDNESVNTESSAFLDDAIERDISFHHVPFLSSGPKVYSRWRCFREKMCCAVLCCSMVLGESKEAIDCMGSTRAGRNLDETVAIARYIGSRYCSSTSSM